MDVLLNKCIATFVGVHVGDSLGAFYETWGPKEISEDIDKRDGLQLFDHPNTRMEKPSEHILPAGVPTDDSEQTACLAMSLLACNGLNTAHFYTLLQHNVVNEQSVLWKGPSIGAGSNTKKALSGDWAREKLARENTIGTNGSLMRASPMALMLADTLMDVSKEGKFDSTRVKPAKELVHAMSSVTHAHQHSKTACWIYVLVLSSLLAGSKPEIAFGDVNDIDVDVKKDLLAIRIGARLKDLYDFPYDPGAFPMRGTAEFTLYVALYALKHATSFADGIEIAIRVGGDTDTYAAVAGGLLGAHFGYEAIPEAWRKTILGHDVMVDLATQMYHRFRAPT